jgi:hypothetical protein
LRQSYSHPEILHEEGELVGRFFDLLGSRFAGTVSGFRLDPDENRSGTGLSGLKCCRELERVSRNDPIVMIRSRYKRCRIFRPGPDVLKRRIFPQKLELLRVI